MSGTCIINLNQILLEAFLIWELQNLLTHYCRIVVIVFSNVGFYLFQLFVLINH